MAHAAGDEHIGGLIVGLPLIAAHEAREERGAAAHELVARRVILGGAGMLVFPLPEVKRLRAVAVGGD